MSFLNPVNEPVLRFSSTDADAPQINYNSRVAGDIKVVLKACLVTGYGAKASAGWSVVNEVDHVAEFVSPSAAMSDYRLGISDTSTSSTTWYYQYQDVRVDPGYNTPTKSFGSLNKTNNDNGWQLFVTERGIVFIEIVQHSVASKMSTRITHWGQIKSAVPVVNGKNVSFFNIGHSGATGSPDYFYRDGSRLHTMLESYTSAFISSATAAALSGSSYTLDASVVDLVSPIYLTNAGRSLLIAELPPMLSVIVNNSADLYGVSDTTVGGRPVFKVCAGPDATQLQYVLSTCRTFLIRTDYWEY